MLWPLCGTQHFWPVETHLPTMASVSLTHTHHSLTMAKRAAENVKDLVLLGHTPRGKKKDITIYFTLVIFPQCSSISPSTFTCTHVFTNLQDLNEIYIRKCSRCCQTRCLQPKHRANKHVIWKDTYLIYKVSKLVRWLGQLLTFLRVNCNSWVVVNTINAIFSHLSRYLRDPEGELGFRKLTCFL